MKISEIAALANRQAESLVQGWFPAGTLRGREYKVGDLSGSSGSSLSINVDSGKWADFATGQRGGDIVSLYAAMKGLSQKDAAREVYHNYLNGSAKATHQAKPRVKETLVDVVPHGTPPPDFGDHDGVWEYRNAEGGLLFYVVRYNTKKEDGSSSKELRPFSLTTDGRWVRRGRAAPRPLYDLPAISSKDSILIVEGEKAADAARSFCGKVYAVTTWPNGAQAWDKTDWSPVYGKRVLIWPDHDDPGRQAAAKIGAHLLPHCPEIKILDTTKDEYPEGWDAADSGFSWADFKEWAKPRAIKVTMPEVVHRDEVFPDEPPMPTEEDVSRDTPQETDVKRGVYCLGYFEQMYFYTSTENKYIIKLSASSHQKNELLNLMPLEYWRSRYPSSNKPSGGVSWVEATNDLMAACRDRGLFSPSNIRSTGAWWHEGGLAINSGEGVLINGTVYPYEKLFGHKYAYEPGDRKMPLPTGNPMSSSQASELFKTVSMLSWDKPIYAQVLVGWITIAPFCGSMKWRPHLWLSGKSGAGKSTVLEDIVKRMLNPFSINVHGSTTEAGVRQLFGRKAMPLLFDEFETSDLKSSERVQSLVELFRQASFESDSSLVKGSSGGGASFYTTRFCGLVSAINVRLLNEADRNRFCVIELSPDPNAQRDYLTREHEVKRRLGQLTDDYAMAYYTRTFGLWPNLRASMKVIAKKIKASISGRIAQQYAPILAGYWHSMNDEVISEVMAQALIGDVLNDLSVKTDPGSVDFDSDEYECLRYIMTSHVKVNGKINQQTNLSELIEMANLNNVMQGDYLNAMKSYGLSIVDDKIAVANRHPELFKLLRGTKWEKEYSGTLKRIPGASNYENKAVSFGSIKSKVTLIPKSLLS